MAHYIADVSFKQNLVKMKTEKGRKNNETTSHRASTSTR